MDLPAGTVTFLLTDIEGSTRLWEASPGAMGEALARHDALADAVIARHRGCLVKSRGEGDSLFAVFRHPADALSAALALQAALASEPWPGEMALRVRMSLHTGEAEMRQGDYYGPVVNRCARLRAAAHGGQVLVSGACGELAAGQLPDGASLVDMGSHRLRDLSSPEHIYQLVHSALPSDFPPLRALSAFPTNLPVQVTSFVGRERETADVLRLLRATRLLTLTGAGGCGKTRLALHAAADVVDVFPDGVWLVELATLADAGLVPQVVARVLGIREEPARSVAETLADQLTGKRLLLVIDNCEHLTDACAGLLEGLLGACAGLHVLATSREVLRVPAETVYRVPSLPHPDPERPLELQELGQYESVRLFRDRAAAAEPGFEVTRGNAAAIARICHRLDGIPLAIELAAARVRALPPQQIADRLSDAFRLLTGGSRAALPRHQTLLALVAWSHDLLNWEEQTLFRRLGAFVGGWALEAAEEVAGGDPIAGDVLDLLQSLVDKSLVLYDGEDGGGRYRYLQTVGEFARQRLDASGEAASLAARHRAFYARQALEAGPRLAGPEQSRWLDSLEADHGNLRAALLACQGDAALAAQALQMAGALARFWLVRGYLAEGRERLAAALANTEGAAPSAERADALTGAASLADEQGDFGAASAMHRQSLEISRALGDQKGIAASLSNLGLVAYEQGRYDEAWSMLQESLAIRRELGDGRSVAVSLNNLALVAVDRGDYAAGRDLLEQNLHTLRQLGDTRGVTIALNNLGQVAWAGGDTAAARAYHEQSLALKREIGDRRGIATSLSNLGLLQAGTGDRVGARRLYRESLDIRRELGDRRGMAESLNNLALLAIEEEAYQEALPHLKEGLEVRRGLHDLRGMMESLESFAALLAGRHRFAEAVALLGASEALHEASGAPLMAAGKQAADRICAAARDALGADAVAEARSLGRGLTLEQAVERALATTLGPQGAGALAAP